MAYSSLTIIVCVLLIYGELEGPRDTKLGTWNKNGIQKLLQNSDPNPSDGGAITEGVNFERLSPQSHKCYWLEMFRTRPPDSPLQNSFLHHESHYYRFLAVTVKWIELLTDWLYQHQICYMASGDEKTNFYNKWARLVKKHGRHGPMYFQNGRGLELIGHNSHSLCPIITKPGG